MNSYGSCSEDHSRGEVGIAAARHVYGPASVHLLPCKIHHTGDEKYEHVCWVLLGTIIPGTTTVVYSSERHKYGWALGTRSTVPLFVTVG